MSDFPAHFPMPLPGATPTLVVGRWLFADESTGVFIGRSYVGPADMLAPNTPAGSVAYECEPGERPDILAQRVDIGSGELIDYQPPAPADTDAYTWAWNATTKRWESSPTLLTLKARRWLEIKAQRDAAEFGGFTWDGSTFDCDSQSQARLMGAAQLATLATLAQQAFAIDWTLQDNTVRTLSGADMIAAGQALGVHVGTAHATARALRAAIEAADSAEELDSITWPTP